MRTGQTARRVTRSATDPERRRSKPLRLCVPRTIRSHRLELAWRRMTSTGSPCWTLTLVRTPAASEVRRSAAIAVVLRARPLSGLFAGRALTTASSASCARLSASAWLNAACAGSEKSTAQRMRESFVTVVLRQCLKKRTTQLANNHARGALAMGRLIEALLTESRRPFAFRESRLRRPTLYRSKIDTNHAFTRPITNPSPLTGYRARKESRAAGDEPRVSQ